MSHSHSQIGVPAGFDAINQSRPQLYQLHALVASYKLIVESKKKHIQNNDVLSFQLSDLVQLFLQPFKFGLI